MGSLTLSTEQRTALRNELAAEGWRRGHLRHLLHGDQRVVYDRIWSTSGQFVLEIARRWGKTWLLVVLAFETCLRTAGVRVVYGAPTLKHLGEFILPTFDAITALCPEHLRPKYNAQKGHLEFPNGSWIHLFGADDKRKASRGRGPNAALAIFDEAGFTPVLEYVIKDVFRPSLLLTGGRQLLGSTPADVPDHDFTAITERAEATGNYARRTIHDNPMLAPQRIAAFIAESAQDSGLSVEAYIATDTFKREYLAERVVDRLLVVVPEWAEVRKTALVRVPRPELYDGLTWLDFGGNDPHAMLYAYWHFELAKTVVVGERLLRNGENTQQLAEAIKADELTHFGADRWDGTLRGAYDADYQLMREQLPDWMADAADEEAPQQPYARWADNNLALVRDLYELHGLAFGPTAKDDKQMQVNNFRVQLVRGEWLIDPSCEGLDRHLRTTTWQNHKRVTYRRLAGEHGDLLDCAVYGARNLYKRNPYPVGYHAKTPRELLQAQAEAKRAEGEMSPLERRIWG